MTDCTRCGTEFRTYTDEATYIQPLKIAGVEQYGIHDAATDHDYPSGYLCPNCTDIYNTFMDGGRR